MQWWGWLLLSGVGSIGVLPAVSWACAVCWGADDGLAHGLNVSILFLMSMPFFISGSIFGVIYVAYRRAQGRHWPAIISRGIAWNRRRKHRE